MENFGDVIEMVDLLTIEAFTPHVDQYRSRIARFGVKISKDVLLGQSLFCQRIDRWKIDPHTHNLPQIIQSMIYFPKPGSSEEQGTVLFRIKGQHTVPAREFATTRTFAPDTIERASILPYKPNCLVSFINTPEAVHGTNQIAGPARRYIFSCMSADVEIGTGDITIGHSRTEQLDRVG